MSFDGEISECEDTSQHSNMADMDSESFDRLIPFHQLLDVSPNRSKAELAHKGALKERQRPSTEALRTAILRRTVSTTSNVSQSVVKKNSGSYFFSMVFRVATLSLFVTNHLGRAKCEQRLWTQPVHCLCKM